MGLLIGELVAIITTTTVTTALIMLRA